MQMKAFYDPVTENLCSQIISSVSIQFDLMVCPPTDQDGSSDKAITELLAKNFADEGSIAARVIPLSSYSLELAV